MYRVFSFRRFSHVATASQSAPQNSALQPQQRQQRQYPQQQQRQKQQQEEPPRVGAATRWRSADIVELMQEAESLESKQRKRPIVLCTLYDVICRKALSQQPANSRVLHAIMPAFAAALKQLPENMADKPTRHSQAVDPERYKMQLELFQTCVERGYTIGIVTALSAQQWEVADDMWRTQ